MIGWALTLLLFALIAGVLGATGVAHVSLEIAQILFFIALVLIAFALVSGLMAGRRPRR